MADQLSCPYYIVAPRYARTSAGVRVLYRLADLINKQGGSAFVYLWPHFNRDLASSPMDIAPFLTRKTVDYHFQNGITPIVIYPETARVGRFDPPVRVRYLLNYDELLFKNDPLENDDYLLSYSDAIAKDIRSGRPRRTLFLPVSDPVFFCPPTVPVVRHGAVFYAGKFKYHFGGKTFPLTDGLPEITRDRPDSQTPEEIRALFQRSEFFYCYEDSALALEAILCGCPTVFLINEHFKGPLGAKEINGLGFAVGTDPAQLEHARNTVVAAREQYLRTIDIARQQVAEFIEDTQAIARARPYRKAFAAGYMRSPGPVQRIADMFRLLRDVVIDRGWGGMLRIVFKRTKAGRFNISS